MNIQQIVDNYPGIVSLLFSIYGINQPVNYDTLSAAIALYGSENGNAFTQDLLSTIDENNYEDYDEYDELFGLGKKGREKRAAKREERGGYSRAGAVLRKIGIAKNRPAQGGKLNKEAETNTAPRTPVTREGDRITDDTNPAPNNKITIDKVLGVVQQGVDLVNNAKNTLTGVGDEAGGGGNDDLPPPEPKWYQKPLVLVGIGVGALALIGVIIMVAKGGGKK